MGKNDVSENKSHLPTKTTLKSNEERCSYNTNRVCPLSKYYRGCWHMTCPQLAFGGSLYLRLIRIVQARKAPRHANEFSRLPWVRSEYVSRLLLSVEMVAVSQAPSPESNPNSPLPVDGSVVQDTTLNLMGQMLE